MYVKKNRSESEMKKILDQSPLGAGVLESDNPVTRYLATELAIVWDEFYQKLKETDMVKAIESGTISLAQYQDFLVNLRQQVIEGGRWISLAASSMDLNHFKLRSMLIKHAAEEHTDYQMLEKNFVASGGELSRIVNAPKNIGSEAFSAYMFYKVAQPNPVNIFGSMFIIEGLGHLMAGGWAQKIIKTLQLDPMCTTFLSYHGENDDNHYEKLRAILVSPMITDKIAQEIVRTAKVTGRLYCLQIEEINHI